MARLVPIVVGTTIVCYFVSVFKKSGWWVPGIYNLIFSFFGGRLLQCKNRFIQKRRKGVPHNSPTNGARLLMIAFFFTLGIMGLTALIFIHNARFLLIDTASLML